MQDEEDGAGVPNRRERLEAALRRAVALAAEDPDAFMAEVRAVADRFGMTAAEVYRKLEQDPELKRIIGREALRRGIRGAALAVKEKLGL